MKNIKELGLFAFFLIGLSTCCQDPDTCFSMQSIQVQNQDLLERVNPVEPDTIGVQHYGLRLTCGMQSEICMLNGFGSHAYATSCKEGEYVLANPVSKLSIVSRYSLSQEYPPGAELKELFKPWLINLNCADSIQLDSSCYHDLSAYRDSIASFETVFNRDIATEEFFAPLDRTTGWVSVFVLRKLPSDFQPGMQQFSLLLTYPNGLVDTIEAAEVYLK